MRNRKLTYEKLNGLVEGKGSVFFKTHEGSISDADGEDCLERWCLEYEVKVACAFPHNLLDFRGRGML